MALLKLQSALLFKSVFQYFSINTQNLLRINMGLIIYLYIDDKLFIYV